jgi:hypothetical protein
MSDLRAPNFICLNPVVKAKAAPKPQAAAQGFALDACSREGEIAH